MEKYFYKRIILKVFNKTKNKEETLEIVKDFLILWTLYEDSFMIESEIYNLENSLKKIKKNSDKWGEKTDYLEPPYLYFKNRYKGSNNKKFTALLGKRILDFDKKNLKGELKNFYDLNSKETLNEVEKIQYLNYVVYRFRNNIFHGNKHPFNWGKYIKEIEYCNYFLGMYIDH